MGNLPNEDAVWLDSALKSLSTVPVSAVLQQNILVSFDTTTAWRRAGVGGAMRRLAATVWPGVPAWRPAAALAFSLVVGVMAGTLIPLEDAMADSGEQTVGVALDAPPAFDLNENS
jgi:hypothetical protein